MSPRKPAVLRGPGGAGLREHLITTAARLIGERGSAGLSVRDIAREAQVADGVLYNYFEDKEDLLAHALLAHVGNVMGSVAPMPEAGTATVAENLQAFIERGFDVLGRVTLAFAGLMSQPNVLRRFHAMAGGDAAFDPAARGSGRPAQRHQDGEGRGLPAILTAYLAAEQRLGRVGPGADIGAAASMVVGAIHGQILPRMLFSAPGTPVALPEGLAKRLTKVLLDGIAPPRDPR